MFSGRKLSNLDEIYGDIGGYPMKVHRKIIAITIELRYLK